MGNKKQQTRLKDFKKKEKNSRQSVIFAGLQAPKKANRAKNAVF